MKLLYVVGILSNVYMFIVMPYISIAYYSVVLNIVFHKEINQKKNEVISRLRGAIGKLVNKVKLALGSILQISIPGKRRSLIFGCFKSSSEDKL